MTGERAAQCTPRPRASDPLPPGTPAARPVVGEALQVPGNDPVAAKLAEWVVTTA